MPGSGHLRVVERRPAADTAGGVNVAEPRFRIGPADEIGDRYLTIQAFAPAARAILRGPLGTPLGRAPRQPPHELRDIAASWLGRARRPGLELWSVVMAAEVPLGWADLPEVTCAVLDAAAQVAFLATDFATDVVATSVVGGLGNLVPQAVVDGGRRELDSHGGHRGDARPA